MRTLAFLPVLLLPLAAQTGAPVGPCQNFYLYACSAWKAANPIPADQSRWGVFNELNERNQVILRDILEKAATGGAGRTPDEQRIGDYYAACMDVNAINRKGIAAIQPELDRINALPDKTAITGEIAHLHRSGVDALFGFDAGPDFKNSRMNIAEVDQGGLGLPDRDYYLKTDTRSVELRKQYQAHVQKMFELLGVGVDRARQNAQTVLDLETALAKGSLDRVSRRNPRNVYHKMTRQELISLNPGINWQAYFQDISAPSFDTLNVADPTFFRRLEEQIVAMSLDQWKVYLTWHLLHSQAHLLPDTFVNENFRFYGNILTGAKELRPRWKRCVSYADNELGDALGKLFVERTFGAEGKERTLKMVQEIEKAMAADIEQVDWMAPETKKQALIKLHAVTNKIGYPEKWRDYSSVRISRDDALGNSMRASEFEFNRQTRKIGEPVDRAEWHMTPPTVNAYYDPTTNSINFPAGILQPPFYDKSAADATNFGGIGSVIGHELTHGFDDQGRQFDADGNLRDWWTASDAKAFEARAQCFIDQYSAFTVAGDVHLNGKLTLGENIADNGGARLALMALLDIHPPDPHPAKPGDMTEQQRLFQGFAQIWCENQREEDARLRAATDPHSPAEFRVNGVLQNMPEFQKAFACKAGDPMVRAKPCRTW
jgi:endothelin-converting enzyme/putative endopeptidase